MGDFRARLGEARSRMASSEGLPRALPPLAGGSVYDARYGNGTFPPKPGNSSMDEFRRRLGAFKSRHADNAVLESASLAMAEEEEIEERRDALKVELDKMNNALSHKQQQAPQTLEQMQAELRATRKNMLHYKATNMELQYVKDELTQHRAQSNMHLSELIALRTELRNTKAESDVRAMKLARVQSELHALKMSASDLSRSSDKALREKESESDKLRHEMIRVKHRLEHTSAEAAELRLSFQALQKDHARAVAELEVMKARGQLAKEDLLAKITSAEAKVAGLEQEKQALQADLRHTTAELTTETNEKARLVTQNAIEKSKAEHELAKLQSTLDAFKTTKEDELAKKRAHVSKLDSELKSLEAQLATARSDAATAQQLAVRLESELAVKQGEHQSLEREMERVRGDMEGKVASLNSEVDELRVKLAQAEQAHAERVLLLEKELESATHTHEAALREMQEQARVNQEQIEASRDHQIAHIRSETEQALSELKAEKDSELAKAQAAKEQELSTLSEENNQQIASLTADFETRIADLEAQIAKVKQEAAESVASAQEACNQQIVALQTELGKMQDDAREEIKDLEEEKDEEIARLEAQLNEEQTEAKERIANLLAEKESIEKTATEEILSLNTKLEQADMMQKVLNQQILTTKQEVAALSGVKAQLADAQRQLAQSAAELEELRKSQLSMHADLQLKAQEYEANKRMLQEQLDEKTKSGGERVAQLESQIKDQSQQIQVSTNELAALKTSFAELEAKLTTSADEADTKIRELEGQLDVARNAIQVKDEECSQFKGMAESTSQQLSTAESEMQELKSQKEHQDADLQRERERADGLDATARALEEQTADLRSQLGTMQLSHTQELSDLNVKHKEKLDQQVQDASAQVEQLREEHETERKAQDVTFQAELKELSARLRDAQTAAASHADQCRVAKNELESRNMLLQESLTTIVEQKFQIEKLQLQAASSEVHTYIPPEQRPAAAPFDVVVSEVRLVELLKPDTANLADEQEKENIETAQGLLEQYAELHSLEAQRKSILEQSEELEATLQSRIRTLQEQVDGCADGEDKDRLMKEDEKRKVEESLATLAIKIAEWQAYEGLKTQGNDAGRRVPAGTSNAKLILAKAKASASEEANVIEERPATPVVHVPESELAQLVQALSQDDYQAKTAAAKEIYSASAPKQDWDIRRRLFDMGVVPMLVSILSQQDAPGELVKYAGCIIAHIARNVDYRTHIHEQGAIPPLVALLASRCHQEGDPDGVLEAADSALVNLCNSMDDIRAEVVGRDAVQYAVQQIGDGSIVMLASKTTCLALTLLRCLLFSDNPERSKEAARRCPVEKIAPMLKLLGARKGSEFGETAERTASIAINIAWSLSSLSRDSPEHQNRIRSEDGIPLLVSLLQGPGLQDFALGAALVSTLANVTVDNEMNAKEICKARGVGPLLRVLLEPSGLGTTLSTRQSAAKALRALTQLLYTDEQRKAVQQLEKLLLNCTPEQSAHVWSRVSRRARAWLKDLAKTRT